MAGRWLAFLNGVIAGPYTETQIARMFADGTIAANDKISREGEMIWRAFHEYDEFSVISPKSASVPEEKTIKGNTKLRIKKKKTGGFGSLFGLKKQSATPVPVECPIAADQKMLGGEIHFLCPSCSQRYSIAQEKFTGEKITCQVCSEPFVLTLSPDLFAERQNIINSPLTTESVADPNILQEEVDFSEEIPEGDITCPHCWKTFSKENVCYISCHPDLLGDPVVGEFEQKRFVPTVYHSSGLPLDARGMACTDMACPHCHLRIPATIVDLSSIYFSIAGAPSSGKSYFLTSMIHKLRSSLPENNLSFYDVDPVINRVLNGYEDTIFMALDQDSVVSLPKTQQIGGDFSNQILKNGISFELPKPFIFRMQETHSSSANPLDKNVIFYDNAGEHFQPGADSIANPATTHLAHSDGIVFLFDPLNDANMRKGCDQRDPQTELNTKVIDQTTLFAEMVNRIRRHGNLVSGQSSDIPLIVAVGKYDTWRKQLPQDISTISPLCENDDDFSLELDWNTIMNVSFMVREGMQNVAPALVAQAEAFFKTVIFVPVSSFGCLASKAETGNIGIIPSQLNPIWVDVPVMLLLAQKGLFPKNTNCSGATPDSALVCKVQDRQIIFRHPVSGRRVSLPDIYQNIVLDINGKKYKMPAVSHTNGKTTSRGSAKKSSVWG